MAVDIGREVADRRADPLIQRASIGQMSSETHPRCADATSAGSEGEEERHGSLGVGVVGREFLTHMSHVSVIHSEGTLLLRDFIDGLMYLLDFVVIACIGTRSIVCEWFRSGELVVAGGSGDDVAVAGDLPCESSDWACDLIDLGEDNDGGEASLRVIGYCGMVKEDTWRDFLAFIERKT